MSDENTTTQMAANCRPRVLVVDNSEVTRRLILELLNEVDYYAQAADGDGENLSQDAIAIANSLRPHVAIIDLRIAGAPSLDVSRAGDDSGLELLKKLTQANCILRSAYLTTDMTRRALREAGAYDVVEAQWSGERLLESVEAAAQDKCACKRNFKVRWPEGWNSAEVVEQLSGPEAPADLVDDLLSQLFKDIDGILLQTVDGSARNPRLSGSRLLSRV